MIVPGQTTLDLIIRFQLLRANALLLDCFCQCDRWTIIDAHRFTVRNATILEFENENGEEIKGIVALNCNRQQLARFDLVNTFKGTIITLQPGEMSVSFYSCNTPAATMDMQTTQLFASTEPSNIPAVKQTRKRKTP